MSTEKTTNAALVDGIVMRYIVDERCGCVAVRDSTKIDPERHGLHGDEDDCVQFWMKERGKVRCECCGHVSDKWDSDSHVDDANKLAAKMNAELSA